MPSMQYDSLRLGLRSSSSVLLIKLRLGFKLLIARTSSEPLLMLGDWEMGLYKDEPMPLSDNQVRLRPTLELALFSTFPKAQAQNPQYISLEGYHQPV